MTKSAQSIEKKKVAEKADEKRMEVAGNKGSAIRVEGGARS